ncbi:unnamed protein product [Dimorphilus gyrociliatus]|uniref:Uncharacterized protein n=1 Tax=Dimorphilus gyrociliatus TaxID=2664684 RepID=A0A7I8VC98_9ANNE|nr:unnamed protein product [Dimorphilus gyrociliatus]
MVNYPKMIPLHKNPEELDKSTTSIADYLKLVEDECLYPIDMDILTMEIRSKKIERWLRSKDISDEFKEELGWELAKITSKKEWLKQFAVNNIVQKIWEVFILYSIRNVFMVDHLFNRYKKSIRRSYYDSSKCILHIKET